MVAAVGVVLGVVGVVAAVAAVRLVLVGERSASQGMRTVVELPRPNVVKPPRVGGTAAAATGGMGVDGEDDDADDDFAPELLPGKQEEAFEDPASNDAVEQMDKAQLEKDLNALPEPSAADGDDDNDAAGSATDEEADADTDTDKKKKRPRAPSPPFGVKYKPPLDGDGKPLPHNVFFVKVPKTGGTTLAVMLQRYARLTKQKVAVPYLRPLINTCAREPLAKLANWQQFTHFQKDKLQVVASHVCMHQATLYPASQWRNNHVPLLITMMRDPWHTIVSEYRYVKKCCHKPDYRSSWCARDCPHLATFEEFVEHFCSFASCSTQIHFVAGDFQGRGQDRVLSRYDFVFLLERFEEGLALLATVFGFPFEVLPFVVSNPNTAVAAPVISAATEARVRKMLGGDYALYREANRRFDATIASLSPDKRREFDETLARLRRVNAQVAKDCVDRRTSDCVVKTATIQHSSACYTECVDAVTANKPLPRVPWCDGKCRVFTVGCQKCECQAGGDDDPDVAGTAKCAELLEANCGESPPKCVSTLRALRGQTQVP